MKKKLSGLYAITPDFSPTSLLLKQVQEAIAGGVQIVQYRRKTQAKKEQLKEAQQLCKLCHQQDVLFLINDDPSLALKVKANGVHLGRQDSSIQKAREMLGKNAIIGISCGNSLTLAQKGATQGVDYVSFGRFFTSRTKPHAPPAPLELLTQAKQCLSLPIVVIGGITPENVKEVLTRGADMVAVVEGLFGTEDIRATARKFYEQFWFE